jgi:HAMP domain-containing protein
LKLQSKLLLSLLLVSILPLIVQGLLFYSSYRKDLTRSVSGHLESVASIQQSRLSAINKQNEERLALVASRTQLRISLERFQRTADPEDQRRMERILADAVSSIDDLVGISVYSPDGIVIASTDPGLTGKAHFDREMLFRCRKEPVIDRLFLDETGEPRIYLSGPMHLDGKLIGVMVIRSRVQNLLASLFDYSGLGETGETVLARPQESGRYIFLAPTRFDPEATFREVPELSGRGGKGGFFAHLNQQGPVRDYRNQAVLMTTRGIPHTDWVLAVKIDTREAFRLLDRTATWILVLAGALMLAVLLSTLRLAKSLSAPLIRLSTAAGAIAGGQSHQKLPGQSSDEIGILERGFNSMADQVAQAKAKLEAKIEELNDEIEERKMIEEERVKLIEDLRSAMSEIKSLKGIIPICSSCKKVRDDQGYWQRLESFLSEHSDAMLSHGLCPDCLAQYEKEIEDL